MPESVNEINEARVKLTRAGLDLGTQTLPLLAGSVHYWRLPPSAWQGALVALVEMGLKLVDTYVPWAVHERLPGVYDFGESDPRLDVVRFLNLAREAGLYAIVRPGPHINAELTRFGIPERVIWNEACQARSPSGRRVVLPVPPLGFPVPSYASRAFLDESGAWLRTVAERLAPLRYPEGPIVLVQVDNEGALYFRDGVYDQDYHPDAIELYRSFLAEEYGSVEALRERYADPGLSFESTEPPRRFSALTPLDLGRHLDWAEAQEHVISRAMRRFRSDLVRGGLSGLPFSHNLPLGENATPLDPAELGHSVDLLGLDYYHLASAESVSSIARRTSELAMRADAHGYTAFSCELGAGFPPFFPTHTPGDNAFTTLCALAYGLRGFNMYMAVQRDRWIGAPVDERGHKHESFAFWQKLNAALEQTRFWELERPVSVALVVPRSLRRLFRALHAFGPLSSAWFEIAGGGARDACVEDDFGLGGSHVVETASFLRELEQRLEALGIPFAYSGSDTFERALGRARWVIVASSGALKPELVERVTRARSEGLAVSFAPFLPERDAAFHPLARVPASFVGERAPLVLPLASAELEQALARTCESLALPKLLTPPPAPARVTVHVDKSGRPRVAFVINPERSATTVRLELPELRAAADLLDGTHFRASTTTLEVPVGPLSVRMLALETDGLAS
ncbi:MAG TPA: beta-galactosidase [Polyangiaceae bacterium]|nr:beta-galactosidase [Polyangiaceae bacterium]